MAGHLLVADEIATHRIALRAVLASARYDVAVVSRAGAVIAAAREKTPDLVLLGDGIALGGSAPLLAQLKRDAVLRHVPVIVLTRPGDAPARLAALRGGAEDVTERPGSARVLLARIRGQLRAADTAEALGRRQATVRDLGLAETGPAFARRATIAVLAHETDRARTTAEVLKARLPHRVTAGPLGLALSQTAQERTDLFVLEAPLSNPGEALGLLAELRARPDTRHAAILVVHHASDTETSSMALDLGANDLVECSFHPEELALRAEALIRRKHDADALRASVDESLRLALLDPLTGLYNRRYAMSHADRVGCAEHSRGYGVILADIDRFKAVNDTHGHAAGDDVLCAVARRLRDNVRSMDMVARIGGEEFLVFLPDPDPEAAYAAAQRLCRQIRDVPVEFGNGRAPLRVTASFGVAMGAPGEPLASALARADAALYRAKDAGRDTVTRAAPPAAA